MAVVINKYWECDPVMGVLLSDHAWSLTRARWPVLGSHPHARTNPSSSEGPRAPDPNPRCRATFLFPHLIAEIWCVSDLLEHLPDIGTYQSSSAQKAERLSVIAAPNAPDLVIAVGTAAFPDESQNNNGSVIVGTRAFLHDGHPGNTASSWAGPFDRPLHSSVSREAFSAFTSVAAYVHPRLIPTCHSPSSQRAYLPQFEYVAVGNANVTNYQEYAVTDPLAVTAYEGRDNAGKRVYADPAGSLETTHGVIRASLGESFLFISGIVDRFRHFDEDVGAAEYAQNFAGAHNAGIALAWILPELDAHHALI